MNQLALLLSLFSGLADATSRGVIKISRVHTFLLIAGGQLFALPFFLVLLFFIGMPEIKPLFWRGLTFALPLSVLANILTVEAHRRSPLILTAPYMSFTPAFLLITSPILGGGTPTRWGAIGIIILVCGTYLLNVEDVHKGIFAPLKRLSQQRGSILMLVVSILYGINANFDAWGIKGANTPLWLVAFHAANGIIILLFLFVYRRLGRIAKTELHTPHSLAVLMLYGLVGAATAIPQMFALQLTGVVPYVIAGKRAGTIIFSIIIGLFLATLKKFQGRYENEKENLAFRIPGILLMLTGMLVILLWG